MFKGKNRISLMFNKAKHVLKDNDRKPILRILKELMVTLIILRCIPTHYFTYFLYRRQTENYLDYLCGKEQFKIHSAFHRRDTLDILDNKLLFHEHFSKQGIKIPAKLGYNLRKMWFSDKEYGIGNAEIQDSNTFAILMENMLQDPTLMSIFAKPIRGGKGGGIIRITKDIFSPESKDDRNQLYQIITGGCFIFEKQIIQHPELGRIHNSSLNTIRMDTFLDDNNNPEVISAILRMGVAGSHVDNLGAGGIFAGIDMSSGELQKIALSKLQAGAMTYDKHPDSGIEFRGFIIPYFAEVKDLARQAARQIPERLVGWDIGISVDGPILIEANGWYELSGIQIAYGGYRRHPVFRKAMKAAGFRV